MGVTVSGTATGFSRCFMLGDKEIIAFVGVSNADKARAFYRDTLGLTMMFEDSLSLTFIVGGIILRATLVDSVQPGPYPVLGWRVDDATCTVRALAKAGVNVERYPHVEQDGDGIWTAPGGVRIARFKDPDGNILSVAQL
jgi:catechol 2,3-dioxygenase-like lactoylglutathione lyase family enzyme